MMIKWWCQWQKQFSYRRCHKVPVRAAIGASIIQQIEGMFESFGTGGVELGLNLIALCGARDAVLDAVPQSWRERIACVAEKRGARAEQVANALRPELSRYV
jgi:hypothetical protein